MIDTRKKEFWDATLEHCTQEERDYILSVLSENKGGWIPVSKRLPEIGHVVYCQLTDGSHEILFLDDDFGQKFWAGRWSSNYKVTAWREMPESYKEGE